MSGKAAHTGRERRGPDEMPVHTFHGVLSNWRADSRLDRLYVPRAAFIEALDALPGRYVPAEACGPHDVALTIDDSTMAAAEASLIARERGHEVTLFLNPHQIITQVPYFFTVLNLSIDRLVERARQTDPGASWRSPHFLQLRQETRALWAPLQGQALDAAIQAFLEHWDLDMPEIPAEVRSIDMPTLARLVAAGVRIGNHGWSHVDIAVMSEQVLRDDVARTRRWLMDATGQPIEGFAVPFGLPAPPTEILERLGGICMLVDAKRPVGELAPGLVNRLDITDALVARWQSRQPRAESVPAAPSAKQSLRDVAAALFRRMRQVTR